MYTDTTMTENRKNAYVIQEQGDLGLGLTQIDKKYIDENGNISIPKDDKTDDDFRKKILNHTKIWEENNDKSMQFLFYDAMCRKVSTKI